MRKTLIEGDYTIINAVCRPAVGSRATLVHIEAAHLPESPLPEAFLGRIMIDTPRASIYDTISVPGTIPNCRLKIKIEIESE